MTDIRELLREATVDVEVERSGPVQQVQRALSRRRRAAAAVGLAVIAVAATIIMSHSLSTPSTTGETAPPAQRATVEIWAPLDGDVVAYAGSLWGLKCCSVQTGQSWVDKLDPRTGRLLARFKVPPPAFQISAGAGRIWVTGFNPGGGGPAGVTAIDPATGAENSLDLGSLGEPHDIAFAHGAAWITQPLLHRVLRLTPPATDLIAPATGFGRASVAIGGGPETIATTGSGQLWVQSVDRGQLRRITPTKAGGIAEKPVSWRRPLLGTYLSHQVLTPAGGAIFGLTPEALAGCDACAQTELLGIGYHHVFAALMTRRGLFATTAHRTYFESSADIADSSLAKATASLASGGTSLAPDGAGVVIGTDSGLVHWIPAG